MAIISLWRKPATHKLTIHWSQLSTYNPMKNLLLKVIWLVRLYYSG